MDLSVALTCYRITVAVFKMVGFILSFESRYSVVLAVIRESLYLILQKNALKTESLKDC